MKRFFLFAWDSQENAGGWADFVDSFESAELAKQHYETAWDGKMKISRDMYDIVDTALGDKGTVVKI